MIMKFHTMKNLNYLWMSLAAALLLTSSCISTSSTTVYAIPDSKTPRTMSPAIFSDVPEGLISELGVEDGIPSSLCSFLMTKDGKNILFDSGNGVEDSQLLPTLETLGVKPENIDYVFITHLHGDHIGGMVKDGKAVFENATVYLNKDEYDGAGNVDESPMGTAYGERLKIFTDADVLPCGVEAIKAYGHTPGHTMYRIGNIVIAGDIMHGTALQLVNPESCARFDRDKAQAVRTRREALESFKEEGLTVYGMHFPEPYYIQF